MTSLAKQREETLPLSKIDARVVVLNNYLRAHHVRVFQHVSQQVEDLKILLSTEMEANRNWQSDWAELDVTVQRNWTWKAKWKHSTGFTEPNYIHVPVNTVQLLKEIKPDVVFSYEMGIRTLLSSRYCRRFDIPLVMVGNMSQQIEKERGVTRRMLRNFLRKRVNYCTYNGPSCKRYLIDLGFSEDQLLFFPYAYDIDKTDKGVHQFSEDGVFRLMFCGALDERKGISLLFKQLTRWCKANWDREIELNVCGTGQLRHLENQPENLQINWLGHCDNQQLADCYANSDVCTFPTLADEWGLVTVEALASGIPVLGSIYAQSVESLVCDGYNGWTFRPDDSDGFYLALDSALNTSPITLKDMSPKCRKSVSKISAKQSADHFVEALETVLSRESILE